MAVIAIKPAELEAVALAVTHGVTGRRPCRHTRMKCLGSGTDRVAIARALMVMFGWEIEARWLDEGTFGGFLDRLASLGPIEVWA